MRLSSIVLAATLVATFGCASEPAQKSERKPDAATAKKIKAGDDAFVVDESLVGFRQKLKSFSIPSTAIEGSLDGRPVTRYEVKSQGDDAFDLDLFREKLEAALEQDGRFQLVQTQPGVAPPAARYVATGLVKSTPTGTSSSRTLCEITLRDATTGENVVFNAKEFGFSRCDSDPAGKD